MGRYARSPALLGLPVGQVKRQAVGGCSEVCVWRGGIRARFLAARGRSPRDVVRLNLERRAPPPHQQERVGVDGALVGNTCGDTKQGIANEVPALPEIELGAPASLIRLFRLRQSTRRACAKSAYSSALRMASVLHLLYDDAAVNRSTIRRR